MPFFHAVPYPTPSDPGVAYPRRSRTTEYVKLVYKATRAGKLSLDGYRYALYLFGGENHVHVRTSATDLKFAAWLNRNDSWCQAFRDTMTDEEYDEYQTREVEWNVYVPNHELPAPGFGKRITTQEASRLLAKYPLPRWLVRESPVYRNIKLCEHTWTGREQFHADGTITWNHDSSENGSAEITDDNDGQQSDASAVQEQEDDPHMSSPFTEGPQTPPTRPPRTPARAAAMSSRNRSRDQTGRFSAGSPAAAQTSSPATRQGKINVTEDELKTLQDAHVLAEMAKTATTSMDADTVGDFKTLATATSASLGKIIKKAVVPNTLSQVDRITPLRQRLGYASAESALGERSNPVNVADDEGTHVNRVLFPDAKKRKFDGSPDARSRIMATPGANVGTTDQVAYWRRLAQQLGNLHENKMIFKPVAFEVNAEDLKITGKTFTFGIEGVDTDMFMFMQAKTYAVVLPKGLVQGFVSFNHTTAFARKDELSHAMPLPFMMRYILGCKVNGPFDAIKVMEKPDRPNAFDKAATINKWSVGPGSTLTIAAIREAQVSFTACLEYVEKHGFTKAASLTAEEREALNDEVQEDEIALRFGPVVNQAESRRDERDELPADSMVYIINISNQQVKNSGVGITCVFVITLNMLLNVVLWAISYRDVHGVHSKDDVEDIINIALEVVNQCSEGWPETRNTTQ
ncbi:hypothetical protein KVR01_007988 [Diaporthe batatas]|uniref:uncharacterized protein n=1 Tax=Diaporthe batatas TaxID=748121 RepID=UPI001D053197|nr:uncharacterized protein KVR01_007988 [Diaporthe batatas]KAG8162223.1 hypothetical protein KVR01_007988 [Diaporthe batatas]